MLSNNGFFFSFVILFLPLSLFLKSQNTESSSMAETNTCLVVIEENLSEIQLGNPFQPDITLSCPFSEVISTIWEPTTGLSCTDCFLPDIYLLQDQCYTLTINWQDGCVSSDEICLILKDCEIQFSENNIVGISPLQIEQEASIELEIAKTQFVAFIIEDDGDVFEIWEGWLQAGAHNLSLDFSDIPSGSHELTVQLFPENKSITIQKI